MGRRGLWLVQAGTGTESGCDPPGNRACSLATSTFLRCPFLGQSLLCSSPRIKAYERPGSLARSSGRNCPEGVEWQFPHQPWLSSVPALPACLPACLLGPSNPWERGGRGGPSLSSWRLKGEAHIWPGLSRPRLGGGTHTSLSPGNPTTPQSLDSAGPGPGRSSGPTSCTSTWGN